MPKDVEGRMPAQAGTRVSAFGNWVVSLSLRDAQCQSQGTNVSGQQVYPGWSLGHDSRATSPLSRPEQSSLWPWLVSEDTIHTDLWIRLSHHVN